MDGFDAPLLRTPDLTAVGLNAEDIRRRVRRGRLVRLRRGHYCLGGDWSDLDDRHRHILLARAVCLDVAEPVLARRSAAAVWGIPLIGGWHNRVELIAPYRGGGKSEPGVRRSSVGARGVPVVQVEGLSVTSLERTVVDIAAGEGFIPGVMAADWALRQGVERDALERALAQRSSGYGAKPARAAIRFADVLAETPGESACRAAIFALGFELPELQSRFVDDEGEMFTDYYWRAAGVAGEFDGEVKYLDPDLHGGSPERVVLREKRREDRLRRQVRTVVRFAWSDLFDGARLARLLVDAGVPRRTSSRLDGPAAGSDHG